MDIATELRELHNYNSLFSIISGINMAPIVRLKITRGLVPQEKWDQFKIVDEVMSPMKSWKQYRSELAEASPPCMPYLGIYLTDFTFVEEGNPDMVDDKRLINFNKRKFINNVVQQISTHQLQGYDGMIEPLEPHRSYFLHMPAISDEALLFNLSLKWEPKEKNNFNLQ